MNNAFKWGGIMALGLIISTLALHYTGMSSPDSTGGGIIGTVLSWGISIAAIVMGLKAYKQANGGYLTMGNSLSQGVLIGLFGGILLAIFVYIFYTFLAPNAMDDMKEAMMAGAEASSGGEEELVEGLMNSIASPGFVAGTSIFTNMIFGFIVSLIAGLIMKNERPIGGETL